VRFSVIIIVRVCLPSIDMTDLIPINQVFSQIALKKLAYFGGSTLGNDVYYLKEFLDMMINIIGEDRLVNLLSNDSAENKSVTNRLGKEWYSSKGMRRRLIKFDKRVDDTKRAYDTLDTNDLKKKDTDSYKVFLKNAQNISVIKPDLYALFVFVISCSSIQKMNIRNEDFKIFQQKGYRATGELNKRKVGDRIEPKAGGS